MKQIETPRGLFCLRELQGMSELADAVSLQLAVWGKDTVPESRELLLAVQHSGGLVGGAFDPSGSLAGMVFSFPTQDPSVQHSHILAVLPRWRGLGLGASLKWWQRDWAIERGVLQITWTVDPLRMPNAELNAGTLGATAHQYYLDYYGAMRGIDAGLPSDRLMMEWRLDSPRVAALAEHGFTDGGCAGVPFLNEIHTGHPRALSPAPFTPQVLLRLPSDFLALSTAQPELALEWRLHTRQLFQSCFDQGYLLCGFTRHPGPAYLLEKTG